MINSVDKPVVVRQTLNYRYIYTFQLDTTRAVKEQRWCNGSALGLRGSSPGLTTMISEIGYLLFESRNMS